MPEWEHGHCEVWSRYAQHAELGHAKPVALLFADGGVNLGLLEAVAAGVSEVLDQLGNQRSRCGPRIQHEPRVRRIRGSDNLRFYDDQFAFTNEGSRESRHR